MNDQTGDLIDPATERGASGPGDGTDEGVVDEGGPVADRPFAAVPGLRTMAGPLLGVALVSLGIGFLLARNVGKEPANAGLAARTVTTPPGPPGATTTTVRGGAGAATSGGTGSAGSGGGSAADRRGAVVDAAGGSVPGGSVTGGTAGTTTGGAATSAGSTTAGGTTGTSTGTSTGSTTGTGSTAVTTAPAGTTTATTVAAAGTTVAPTTATTAAATTTTRPATTTTTRPATTTTRAATTTTKPPPTTVPGSAYAAAVVASSPLAYWRLDEAGGGTAVDGSSNGRNGVYAGGFFTNQPGAVRGGAAVRFDTSGCVEVPDAAALRLNGAFTIELWARMDRFLNTWPGLVVKGAAATADGYLVYYDTSGRVILKRNNVEVASAPGALRTDRFTHLAVTYDGSTVRWYVDGALSASAAASFPTNSGSSLLAIGRGDQYGDHTVDEVAVYGSALSAATLAAHVDAARR